MTTSTIKSAWGGARQWATGRSRALPMVIALVVFGLPLFIGLDNWDLENDEAIYSYSVDRMLENGDWLNPRSIMVDGPFLEKPPLKTWIVAAGITLGLPRDERGLRFFDALFGLAAFAYVFAIGRRLSGLVCAFTALLVLHTCWPLMFEHGLRTNSTDAALVLSYCGGVYHFFRWTEADTVRQRRVHAWSVALFFVLGFLTKFVAALFLPVVLATAFLWQGDVRSRLRAGWRDWVLPAIAAVVLIAPWFIYQSFVNGRYFWDTIVGVHVLQRFTSDIFPSHIQPWHFYFTSTFASVGRPPFPVVITVVGLALLCWQGWHGRPSLARLLLAWWIVPYVLMSFGTSKLFHYAYPFFPPLALAAGLAAAAWMDVTRAWIGRVSAGRSAMRTRPAWQRVLVAGACLSLAIGLWSTLVGPLTISAFGVQLFRNSDLARPTLIGVLLLAISDEKRAALWAGTLLVLFFATPVTTYVRVHQELTSIKRPLRAIRDCVVSTVGVGTGVYVPDPTAVPHPQYYYLRTLGPWAEGPANRDQELVPRLFTPGRQTPVLMAKQDPVPSLTPPPDDRLDTLKGVETIASVVVWLPGMYAACAEPAVAAGGSLAVAQTKGPHGSH